MPQPNGMENEFDVLPAEKGLVYANLARLMTMYGAIAARTFGEAELELLVRGDPDNDVGDYSWFSVDELSVVVPSLNLVPN